MRVAMGFPSADRILFFSAPRYAILQVMQQMAVTLREMEVQDEEMAEVLADLGWLEILSR